MKIPFSAPLWELFSGLWKKQGEDMAADPDVQTSDFRETLYVFFMARRALKSEQTPDYQLEEAWKNVERCTRKSGRQRMMWMTWIKYAAVLFFFLGTGLFYLKYNSSSSVELAATDSIMPGCEKAELILATGERILLNARTAVKEIGQLGVTLRNDDQNGKLHYETMAVADTGKMEFNVLYVPKGGEYSLILPDGSQVWLNSETSLRFPVQFSKNKREVYLNGEAYFKIAKDTTAPFHVHAGEKEITVLGTTFNVSAYESDEWWQTTLVEGKVGIQEADRKLILKPAEQYFIDRKTGVRQLKKVDPEWYTSWVDGKFYFKAYTFEEIVKKLERWYDFTMIYQSEDIKQMRFSGTINKHHPIQEMLHYLEMTTDIHFSISGKNIVVGKS